jgi:hypothetical protein
MKEILDRLNKSLIILFLSFITACAQMGAYQVKVDSVTDPEGTSNTLPFLVLPAYQNLKDDLVFKEFQLIVENALLNKGFVEAEDPNKPWMAILLSYGLGDPVVEERNDVLPIFGQTGVSSSFTTGTLNSYGQMTTYSGTTTYTPQYGITGYAPVSSKVVKHPKYIVLSAYEAEPDKRVKDLTKLWETNIYCDNGIDDLRRSFPVMVAAAQNYIGTNTRHEINVALYEEDPAVTSLYSKRKSEKSQISPNENGKAIPIKEVEASATNGDVYSQTLLGVTNFDRKNFGESFKWFEMAAAQGDCLAQYFLAVSYESGLGTSSNPEKSLSWALKAANQGLVEAQHYVAMDYFLANKHPMDMVHAYAWAFTAYMNGDDEASKIVHMAKDKMSSEQLEAALQEHYSIMKTNGFNGSSDKYKCTTYR